jgi:acetate kinase
MTTKTVLAKGVVEKIGLKGSFLKNETENGEKVKLEGEIIDHQAGIEYILGVMISEEHGCIDSLNDINGVGHRVVHGGEAVNESVLITDEVIDIIKSCFDIAPLHNPPNLKGIEAIQQILPNVRQVSVFDTAFHQTMPDHAYMYAIPYSLYKKYGVRRYGFHGTSHRYVSKLACKLLNKDYSTQKMITCHLGNGASVSAVKNGKSVDTSMGLTPVEGLVMGTRTGDLDLGVLTYIMDKEEIGIHATSTLINKHSGMLGISGISSDMREIENAFFDGDERARLALQMYDYRVKKYIGSYIAAMNGVDILVFTGGIGENADITRAGICKDLEFLGIEIDEEINNGLRGKDMVISKKSSKVTVIVVQTNEELVIAEDTVAILEKNS